MQIVCVGCEYYIGILKPSQDIWTELEGRKRMSLEFAAPSFIPKADRRKVLPRWVCDYRELNANTVPDNFPLPRVDDILADCVKVNLGYHRYDR